MTNGIFFTLCNNNRVHNRFALMIPKLTLDSIYLVLRIGYLLHSLEIYFISKDLSFVLLLFILLSAKISTLTITVTARADELYKTSCQIKNALCYSYILVKISKTNLYLKHIVFIQHSSYHFQTPILRRCRL